MTTQQHTIQHRAPYSGRCEVRSTSNIPDTRYCPSFLRSNSRSSSHQSWGKSIPSLFLHFLIPLCSLLASKSNYVSSITVWLQYNKRIWPYPLLPCIILYIFLIFCRWDLLLLLLCHGKKGSESKRWLLLRNWGRRSDRLVSSRSPLSGMQWPKTVL